MVLVARRLSHYFAKPSSPRTALRAPGLVS